ncbi:hypothetical protein KKC97_10305 [bacterium]|nr:hypothetical protein [bacterium]
MRSGLHTRLILTISLTLALAQFCLPAEGLMLSKLPVDEADRIPRKLEDAGCIVMDISGAWNYRTGGSEFRKGWIPSSFPESEKAVEFVRTVVFPDSFAEYDWELLIPVYRYRVDVSVNGNLLHAGRGDFAALRVPIRPEYLTYGSANEVSVLVQNDLNRSSSVPLQPELFQPSGYAGILSKLYLIGRHGWSFAGMTYRYEIYSDSVNSGPMADLRIAAQVMRNRVSRQDSAVAGLKTQDISVHAVLSDSSRSIAASASMNLSDYYSSSQSHPLRFTSFSPLLWSPDRPYIYNLDLFMLHQKDTLSRWSEGVSFAQRGVDKQGFVCGDSVFKLKAVDYVFQDPAGLPVAASLLRSDLLQIKALGFNAVRLYGSAPPEMLMGLADSLGIWILADIGLNRLPSQIILNDYIDAIRSGPLMQVIRYSRSHPSLLAVCTGSMLEFSDATADSIVNALTAETRALTELPCFIESTGRFPEGTSADFLMIAREPYSVTLPEIGTESSLPMVYSNLGWLSGKSIQADSNRISAQSAALKYQIQKAFSRSHSIGIAVHCFADYIGASPLIIQNEAGLPNRYSFGLMTAARRKKHSDAEISSLLDAEGNSGLISKPDSEGGNPIVFPASALAAMLILSISMRGNNVFRQNLRRVFRHSHGFFSDIRYRRYLPSSHTLLLWILNSAAVAGFLVSVLYWMRESIRLDYFLTFIGLNSSAKATVASLLWSPGQAMLIVFSLVLFCKLLHILYLKLISNLFRPRVSMGQLWNYANWSFTPLLFLLPICAVLYRLLDFQVLIFPSLVLCGLGFIWSLIRLISALQNGFQTSFLRVTLLFVLLTGLIFSGLYFAVDHWLYFSMYWQWMLHVYPLS